MRNRDVTANLASWAASFLASSLVLAVIVLLFVFGVSDVRWLREDPTSVASIAFLLGCYGVSFLCLNKLQKGGRRGLQLWSLSLVTACVPLAVLAYWLGANSGALIIGMAETAAVVLHLVAIGIISFRKVTAHNP